MLALIKNPTDDRRKGAKISDLAGTRDVTEKELEEINSSIS